MGKKKEVKRTKESNRKKAESTTVKPKKLTKKKNSRLKKMRRQFRAEWTSYKFHLDEVWKKRRQVIAKIYARHEILNGHV